ncbi:zinc ABC transporter substrate-binding protein [Sporosarcina sp. ACRSL]|uniref:metal ABC transporter solute-binding protein, Zn/Mn family n=1 Tax=Sporosarcina sp. ACRSL TaxID=2918215 RepID=UPI001EF42521|nr:zinc ABC transporter substrate-binding protein [Sporosarcina sp. ACRSL]MCG7345896.1 zinc ABC transporter substrate-binding protein [Sporosarcina sp. ACRSL]
MSIVLVGLLSSLLVLGACSDKEKSEAGTDGKIDVVTTIAQIAEPISIIGGDHVAVESLMGPGVDPHLYKATQGDIKKLEGSDIVFYSGLNLEGNMTEAFKNIGTKKPVRGISESIPTEKLLEDDNGAIDPHVWFDIELWKIALETATEELKAFAPELADEFEANKESYFNELDALHTESLEKLTQIPEDKRVLVTAHDAFGYFGRAYNIKVVGLQGLSTEDEIGITDIDDTISILMEYKIPAVFVESSINQNSIKAVIEGAGKQGLDVKLGGELYSDAMGDAGTEEGTYIGMYKHNVNTIHKALLGEGN